MITEQDSLLWKEKGCVIVKNLFDPLFIKKCQRYLLDLYKKNELNVNDFGSNGKLEFPSFSILDELTLNETIIQSVQRLLGTRDILLTQSDTWGKIGKDDYSEVSNNDQRMHMDYGNNTFLHPSDWNEPECVSIIIYLSNVKETGGGTCCVPREGKEDILYKEPYLQMPGIGKFPFINDKTSAEQFFQQNDTDVYQFRQELYKREIQTEPTCGDVLFYRLDLWHRGTPVFPGKIRFVTNLVFKRRECYWIQQWNPGWTKKMYYGYMEEMIGAMTPLQRSILGIPFPGNEYWTEKRIYQFQQRFPTMNMKPYIEKLKK